MTQSATQSDTTLATPLATQEEPLATRDPPAEIKAQVPLQTTTQSPTPGVEQGIISMQPQPAAEVELKDDSVGADLTPNGPSQEAYPPPTPSIQEQDQKTHSTLPQAASTSIPQADTGNAHLAGPEATEMTAAQIKFCQNAIKSLKGRPESPAFLQPVNPVALNIPHYPNVIAQPMDLGTVDIKLALTAAAQKGGNKQTEKTKQAISWNLDPAKDVYRTAQDFEKDVRLVFSNCVTFNGPDHFLSQGAKSLEAVFDKQVKSIPSAQAEQEISMDVTARRQSESGASSRPKRDIHPPAPKDLPWADRPQTATMAAPRRKKSRGSMSAREQAHYDKVNKDQLRFVNKVIDDFHKPPMNQFAWVFFEKPSMDLEFAAAYYATIKQPISLKEIKSRLLHGEYDDVEGVKDDVSLMIRNCFTFNEKGSDVYVMGAEVKKAWEAKLAKMPRPPSPEPDYDEDEEEYDEEEDEENDAKAQAIRDQIAALQATLENLEGSSKAAGAKALASAKASLAAVPSKGSKKRRPSESSVSGKKAPTAKKAKSSTTAASSTAASAEPKKPKPKKVSEGSKRRDEDVREVTYEQKEELAQKITQLPDDRLDGALKIIAEDKPPSANDDEEIELDIDDLSPATLYKLYRYVVRPKGKKVTTSKLSASDGRKRGTGGVKRKNLDEGEEAARIARLQQQLQQFDNPDGARASQPPTGVAAGHDDLVASESSSGEEESESDSDY